MVYRYKCYYLLLLLLLLRYLYFDDINPFISLLKTRKIMQFITPQLHPNSPHSHEIRSKIMIRPRPRILRE